MSRLNVFKASAALLAATLSIGAPQRAHALAGAVSGMPILVGVAAGVFLAGAGGLGISFARASKGGAGASLTIMCVALVFLDKGTVGMTYRPISRDTAARAGLSEAERAAYNHELSTINAAAEEIGAELAAADESNESNELERARALWLEYQDMISAPARGGLAKIAAALAAEGAAHGPEARP